MKHLLSIILLVGALAFVSCDDNSSERNAKCIDKLEESLTLVMFECSNAAYVTSHSYADADDCKRFEGGIVLIQYFECKSEDATY